MSNEKTIKGYKGFDKDLKCRNKQYEVGKEYEMDGEISVCNRGFHACENPLDVLDHYFVNDDGSIARFCEVEQSGNIDIEDGGRKQASSKIRIKAELKFADFVKLAVEYVKEKCGKGGNSQAASGDYAKLAASGDSAQLAASGYSAKLAASGYSAKLAASGDYAKLAASGYSAKLAASGDYAKLAASGYSAKLAASGDHDKIESTGDHSVVMAAGYNSCAKAKKGSWITLAEWKRDDASNKWVPVCVKTEQVDGKRIKEDVWYRLTDGEFTEVD